MWLFAILIVLVMGAIAAVAAGRGGAMRQTWTDRPDLDLPTDAPIASADLRQVRFPLAARGYRMSDVDALLERLATQLEDEVRTETLESRAEGASDTPETV